MNIDKLIRLINEVLIEADNYIITCHAETVSINDIQKVLHLLKEQVINNPENINERVLRAMHDIGMSSYKEFENTPLESAIDNLTSLLYNELPSYKTLEPLRKDFGKGYPI